MNELIESLASSYPTYLLFFLPSALLILFFKFIDERYYSKLYSFKKKSLYISCFLTILILFILIYVIEAVFATCGFVSLYLISHFALPPVISVIEFLLLKKYDKKALILYDESKNIITSFTRISLCIYTVLVIIAFCGAVYYINNYFELYFFSTMPKRMKTAKTIYDISFTVLYISSIVIKILSNKRIVKKVSEKE